MKKNKHLFSFILLSTLGSLIVACGGSNSSIASPSNSIIPTTLTPTSSVTSIEEEPILTNDRMKILADNTFALKEATINDLDISSITNTTFYAEDELIYELVEDNSEKFIYNSSEGIYSISKSLTTHVINKEKIEEVSFNFGYYLKDKYDFTICEALEEYDSTYGKFENKKGITFINKDNVKVAVFINEDKNILDGFHYFDLNGNIIKEVIITLGKVDYNEDLNKLSNAFNCANNLHELGETRYDYSDDFTECTATGKCIHCDYFNKEITKTTYVGINLYADFENFTDHNKKIIFTEVYSQNKTKELITEQLSAGVNNIEIYLPNEQYDEFGEIGVNSYQFAIREAIEEANVKDGSINLSVYGLETLTEFFFSNIYYIDENYEYCEKNALNKFNKICLYDVKTVKYNGFENLTSVKEVVMPKCEKINNRAFNNCTSLEYLTLTAEANVVIGNRNEIAAVFGNPSHSSNVNLILNPSNQSIVNDAKYNDYTFKSINFECEDGSIVHSISNTPSYFWDKFHSECNAGYKCKYCDYIEVEEKVHAQVKEFPQEGYSTYTATFNNEAFEEQSINFGYNLKDNTYNVYDLSGLKKWIIDLEINELYNLKLMNDITLDTSNITIDENGIPSASNWDPIYELKSTIDGNGHSINNLVMVGESVAFVSRTTTAANFKNLTFVNPYLYGSKTYTAVFASVFEGNAFNCHVVGGKIIGGGPVAGLFGTINAIHSVASIIGCSNSADIVSTASLKVGGIAATSVISEGGINIVGCANTGNITNSKSASGFVTSSDINYYGCYSTKLNFVNNITDNNFENCYYVGVDSDDSDTLFAVNSDSELNNEEVINYMNAAIDKFLETFFLEFKLRWTINESGVPTLS